VSTSYIKRIRPDPDYQRVLSGNTRMIKVRLGSSSRLKQTCNMGDEYRELEA